MFSHYRKWRVKDISDEDGVIVASDLQQEWLLPWWWDNYHLHNSHSVAFFDFGMSKEMRKWCEERGVLIPLFVPDIFVAGKSEMPLDLVAKSEEEFGTLFWSSRNAWFKKPLACLQSPFKRSLWIDLDCEVRGCLGGLFESYGDSLSLTRYPGAHNSGVIVFRHGIPVFEKWADLSIDQNHLFRGDEDVLNWILQHEGKEVIELPAIYNWSRILKDNPEAIVLHWHGAHGKYCIHHQIMSSNLKSLNLID